MREALQKLGAKCKGLKRPLSIFLAIALLVSTYSDTFYIYADQTQPDETVTETMAETETEGTEAVNTETEASGEGGESTNGGEALSETEAFLNTEPVVESEVESESERETETESDETTEVETEAEAESETETETEEDDLLDEDTGLLGILKNSLLKTSNTMEISDLNTTLSGNVSYSGDENWSAVTRPENYDVSKFVLYAYITKNGESVGYPLEIQNTDISGSVYLQFYDNNGVGNFTIKSVPKTISFGDDDYRVESYKLAVANLDYYTDTEQSVAVSGAQSAKETLALGTLNSAADVVNLSITNNVKGGVNSSISAEYNIKVGTASKNATFKTTGAIPANTEGDSVGTATIAVPANININVTMTRSSIAAVKYAKGSTFSADGIDFSAATGEDVAIDISSVSFSRTLGWTLRYVDNKTSQRTTTPEFVVQYKLDGEDEWTDIVADSSAAGYFGNLGLVSMPEATCSNPRATNSYVYSIDSLPTYAVSASGELKSVSYRVGTKINAGDTYLTELVSGDFSDGSAVVVAKLALEYSAVISWADASRTAARPDIDTIKNMLHMYSFCDGVYAEVTDEADLVLEESTTDSTIWNLKANNFLPRYDANSQGIQYFVVIGDMEITGGNAGTVTNAEVPTAAGTDAELSYKTVYDNGNGTFGNVFDRLYSGGKIVNTIYQEITYSGNVVWNDKAGAVRPKAYVTLMRYVMDDENDTTVTAEKLANAATVAVNDSNGNQTVLSYELSTSGKTFNPSGTDSATVSTLSEEALDFEAELGSVAAGLPRFDGYGKEYFYFTVESFEREDGDTNYGIAYAVGENASDIKGAASGETIRNNMESRVAVQVNKRWFAKSALNDLNDISLSYKLIATDSEGKYHLIDIADGNNTMSGFGDVYTKSVIFVCDLDDGNGGYYEPYGVMEFIKNGASDVDVAYTDLDTNDDEVIATAGTFTIGSNTYTINCTAESTTSLAADYDDITMYTYNVTNIVSDNQDYSIQKTWGKGFEMHVEENGEEVAITSANKDEATYVNDNAGDVVALDFEIKGVPEKGNEIIRYFVHIDVDANSRPTGATLTDSNGDEVASAEVNVTYTDSDRNDDLNRYYANWTADFTSVLPKYNVNGYQYTYTVRERTSGVWNYTHVYYTDEKAIVSNQITSGSSPSLWVYFEKVWKDDGNTDNRADVELHAFAMDDAGNYVDLTTVSGTMPSFIEDWLYANYDSDKADEYKEIWNRGTYSFKTTLSQSGNWNGYITMPVYMPEYVSSYDGTTKVGVVEASVGGNAATYENGNLLTQGSVHNGKYSYKIDNPVNLDFSETANVTNTRYGTVNLNLVENWYDGANSNDTRPEYVDVLMTRNKGESDEIKYYLRQYFDTTDSKLKVKVFDESMNEVSDSDTLEAAGIYLPSYTGEDSQASDVASGDGFEYWNSGAVKLEKYDEYGSIYTYDFEGVTTSDNWNLSSAFATRTSASYKHFGSNTDIALSESTTDDNLDEYTFTWNHRLTGYVTNSTQIEWRDTATTASVRPDIYLSLYRCVDDGNAPVFDEYTDNYNIAWTSMDYEASGYHLLAEIRKLPAFDENGYEYLYYVTERLADTAASMSASYIRNYFYADDTNGSIEWIDKSTKDDYDETLLSDNSAADGERIVNTIASKLTFEFEKIWGGVDGFDASELPKLILTLQQRTAGSVVWNDYTLNGEAVTHLLMPGETEVEFENLPRYNNAGVAYEYRVREEYGEEDTKNTVLDELYANLFGSNTITNTFVATVAGNSRSITIHKYWDYDDLYTDRQPGDTPEEEMKYPTSVFRLFRFRKDIADSVNIDEMLEEGEDSRYYLESKTIVGGENVSDSVTFDDLLVYSPNGNIYYYLVQEIVPEGYTAEFYSNEAGDEYESMVTGVDENGDTYTRPGKITANNTSGYILFTDEMSLDDLDSGKTSVASVRNIYYTHLTGEKMRNITGSKVWKDYNNAYGFRPEDLTLKLYRSAKATTGADNEIHTVAIPYVIKDAPDDSYLLPYLVWDKGDTPETADTWNFTFYNLRKTSANGNLYTYEVKEEYNSTTNSDISTYYYDGTESAHSAKTSANAFSAITNSFTKTFTLQKNWMDGNNKYGFRPAAIKVRLQYRPIGGGDESWQNAAHYIVGDKVYDYSADTSNEGCAYIITATATASNQSVVFKNLPTYVDNGSGTYVPVEYRVYEDAIGYETAGSTAENRVYAWSNYESEGNDGFVRAGSYVREILTETDGNKTVLNNSLISNALTITLNWENDSDNLYQTRPQTAMFNLQYVKVNDDDTINYSDASGFSWENVKDASGNDIIITLSSSDAVDTNTWKKTVRSLAASDETNQFSLFYRVVQVTDDESHPITKVSGADKTYKNYLETTEYAGSVANGTLSRTTALDGTTAGACQGVWEYQSSAGINYVTLTNRLITDVYSRTVKAVKNWHKDESASASFELKVRKSGETAYKSYKTAVTNTLDSIGEGQAEQFVEWTNLPLYDTDGNELEYTIVEKEPASAAYYIVDTGDVTESVDDTNMIKTSTFNFDNVGTFDYTVTKKWENNYYGYAATVDGYTGFTAEVVLLKSTDGNTWTVARDASGEVCKTNLTDEVLTTYKDDGTVLSAGTDRHVFSGVKQYAANAAGEYEYLYYKAVETKINGVVTADGKEYLYTTTSDDETAKAYEITYTNDYNTNDSEKSHGTKTDIVNTLVQTDITLNKVWDDDGLANASGLVRPNAASDVTFELYQSTDGSLFSDTNSTATKVLDSRYVINWDASSISTDTWQATVKGAETYTKNAAVEHYGLPKYASDLVTEITYSVSESLSDTADANETASFARYITSYGVAREPYVITATNTLSLKLDILKVDENSDSMVIPGTKFALYEAGYDDATDAYYSTDNKIGEVTTDLNGKASFEIRETGHYELKEIESSTGYVDDCVFDGYFTVDSSDFRQDLSVTSALLSNSASLSIVENTDDSHLNATGITNERKTGSLTIYKKDGDVAGKTIDGVTFTLYKKSESQNVFESVWNFITGNRYAYTESVASVAESTSGVTAIEDIPWGDYKVVESATVDGYMVDSTPYYFSVNRDTVENDIKLYSDASLLTEKEANVLYNYKTGVTFKKANESGASLEGGLFEIRKYGENAAESFYLTEDEADGAVTSFEMTAAGVRVYGLAAETLYVLHEVTPPTGYKLASDVTFFIGGADKSYDVYTSDAATSRFENNVVSMTDKAIDLDIKKVDSENASDISGAKFEISGYFIGETGDTTISDLAVNTFKSALNGKLMATLNAGGTEGVDKFTYTIKETVPARGYKLPDDDEGFAFTINTAGEIVPLTEQASYGANGYASVDNTAQTPTVIFENDKVTVDVTLSKVFADNSIFKGDIRPAEVTLSLYKKTASMSDAVAVGDEYVHTFDTSDLTEDTFEYVFEDLPLYEYTVTAGVTTVEKITYTAVEDEVPLSYAASLSTTDDETDTTAATAVNAKAVNTAVQQCMYASVDNVTVNNERYTPVADRASDMGGTVSLGGNTSADKIDETKDIYSISFKPAENWMVDDGFVITYQNWDAASESDVHTITVDGIFDAEGNLITDKTAACYAELLNVYPYFEIGSAADNTITLCLDDRDDKTDVSVPYKTNVDVTFVPTARIENLSGIPSQGAVSTNGVTYIQMSAPADGRSASTTLYAKATAGCFVSLNDIRFALPGQLSTLVDPLSGSELLQVDDETYTFSKTLDGYSLTGDPSDAGSYEFEGVIRVADTDEYGNATLIEISFTNEYAPIDVGVTFINNTSNTYSLVKYWRNETNEPAYNVSFELQYKKGDDDWASFTPARTYSVSKDEPADSEAWRHFWDGLETYEIDPVTNESVSINYRIVETGSGDGYTLETLVSKSGLETTYTFANIKLMDYTVTSRWTDNIDTLPSGSEYTTGGVLQRSVDGGQTWETVAGKEYSFTWNDFDETVSLNNEKSYTFTDLPMYLPDGTQIKYRAKQTEINGNNVQTYTAYKTEYDYPDTVTTKINNIFKAAYIEVTKVDADGNNAIMPGVTFTAYTTYVDDTGRVRGEEVPVVNPAYANPLTTDANGKLTFMVFEPGVYELVENAPTGYVEHSEFVEITEDDMQQTKAVRVDNIRKTGRLVIKKVDKDSGASIDGVTFALYKKDDTDNIFKKLLNFITGNTYRLSQRIERNNDGSTVVNNLAWGEYYIIEETTADGYVLTSDRYDFIITADNAGNDVVLASTASSLEADNTITNYKNRFTVKEKSVTENNISGGSYVIYKAGTSEAASFALSADATSMDYDDFTITDKNAGVTIYGLPEGSYTLHEVSAPENYSASEDINFYMSETGVIYDALGGTAFTANGTNVIVKYDMPLERLLVTKVFLADNSRDDASYGDWSSSIRGDHIMLQLVENYNDGANNVRANVGDPIRVGVNAHVETFTHNFINLPKYKKLADGSYALISYEATESDVDTDFYTVTHSAVTAEDGIVNQESENISYKETITNSAEAFQNGAYLEITKQNVGGPQSAAFKLEVKFGLNANSIDRVFKDSYEIYEYDAATNTRGTFVRSASAADGYVTLKGGEMAVVKFPNHVYYSVEEIQTTPPQYEAEGTYSDASRYATDTETDRYDLVNTAVLYTGIQNATSNGSVENAEAGTSVNNAGGTVGVIVGGMDEDSSVPTEYAKEENVEGAISVYWKNEENWTYDNSFTIKYRQYDDPTTGTDAESVGTITVNNYIDENGQLITDTNAACYDELRAVYPHFSIRMSASGAIVLHLANTDDDVQYVNEVIVAFLPTIAVINTTADRAGGKVKVDGGVYRANSDGAGDNGESRYVNKTKVYATAEKGYVLDLNNIEIGTVGNIVVDTASGSGKLASANQKMTIKLTKTKAFSAYLNENVGGSDSTYEIDGAVHVISTDSKGAATAIELELDKLPIPVDIGVKFVKASAAGTTDDSDTNGTADDDDNNGDKKPDDNTNTNTENPGDNENKKPDSNDDENGVVPTPGDTSDVSGVTPSADGSNPSISSVRSVLTGDFDNTIPVSIAAGAVALAVLVFFIIRRKKRK